MPAPYRRPGSVGVIVTVLNDPRVVRTVESLRTQTRRPDAIIVADGSPGSDVESRVRDAFPNDPIVVYRRAPGTIAESRNQALRELDTEFVAFLDADEVAPPGWLATLLEPFTDPGIGFVGGPTPALDGTVRTRAAQYYDGYLRRFYDTVARRRPHALPMGNSAWRMALFDRLGLLDTTLFPRASSEDQEFAVRALAVGVRGVYRPEAFVWHDYTGLTLTALLRKQSLYAIGGYVVWRRLGTTYEASGAAVAPYLLPPALLVVGAVVAAVPSLAVVGAVLLAAGAVALGAVALALWISGRRLDRSYPGLRYRPLEILRRWATIVGAARGFARYDARGAPRRRSNDTASSKR